ncbi:hypothetical protein EVAR_54181_1 [Eumeta japonica]|uniref:Uncharacterized protein n=1 Tax=Eumeta variegata TaxID=151549 RepID=A0A4C1ZB29_EUMVA|nr:hypothetical protein EVAR_54181_1 [Eumeta japonica]
MSSEYVAYKLGDKEVPCGSPTRIGSEAYSLTATQKLRWWRKLAMTLVRAGGSRASSSLCREVQGIGWYRMAGMRAWWRMRFMAAIALLRKYLIVAVDILSGPGAFFLSRCSTILCNSAGDINRSSGKGGGRGAMNLCTLSST